MKKVILSVFLALAAIGSAQACVMCGPGTCRIVSGNGFQDCDKGSCSGNCTNSSGGGGGGGSGGWGGGGGVGGWGWPRFDPSDDDQWFAKSPATDVIVAGLPDVKNTDTAAVVAYKCTDCKAEAKGPTFTPIEDENLLTKANQDWLLAMAVQHFERAYAEDGLPVTGAFAFALADNAKQKQAAMNGIQMSVQSSKETGYAYFNTTASHGQIDAPSNTYFDVEVHLWRVNNQKGVPTGGLVAHLRYEEGSGKAQGWSLFSVKALKTVPLPPDGIFAALDNDPTLFRRLFRAGKKN